MTPPLVTHAHGNEARLAVAAPEGLFTYADLLEVSGAVATRLLTGRDDLEGARVCFLVPPGWEYLAVLWGVWRAGGVAVPLAVSHPPEELAFVLDDAEPEVVVVHPSLVAAIHEVAADRGLTVLQTPPLVARGPAGQLPDIAPDRPALMLYTSGTTGRPKGVVLSHGNLQAQVDSLVEAWAWTRGDHILLHLPLHHVHGIVNVLSCALRCGAVCQILPHFDPVVVWERLSREDLTLYMAVPTVYRRLIEAWDGADAATRQRWSEGARKLRLMVSGSAALPVPTLERWEGITGQRLLERYGMTEIGMALSNPLTGERRPGHVGQPLPDVQVRVVDEDGRAVPAGTAGEIQVKGPGVFAEYWRRPEETAQAFTADGWFRTGDVALVDRGYHRILGRSSVDILKTGGEKVSALEIEDVIRAHAAVADVAVVGVADPEWGDRVCAAVQPVAHQRVSPDEIRSYAKKRMAPYKVPKTVLVVDELPRNAMGKVTKPAVRELFTT